MTERRLPPEPYESPAFRKRSPAGFLLAAAIATAALALFLYLSPSLLPFLAGMIAGNALGDAARRLYPNTDARRVENAVGALPGTTFHWAAQFLAAIAVLAVAVVVDSLLGTGIGAHVTHLGRGAALLWALALVAALAGPVWRRGRDAFAPHPSLGPPKERPPRRPNT